MAAGKWGPMSPAGIPSQAGFLHISYWMAPADFVTDIVIIEKKKIERNKLRGIYFGSWFRGFWSMRTGRAKGHPWW